MRLICYSSLLLDQLIEESIDDSEARRDDASTSESDHKPSVANDNAVSNIAYSHFHPYVCHLSVVAFYLVAYAFPGCCLSHAL